MDLQPTSLITLRKWFVGVIVVCSMLPSVCFGALQSAIDSPSADLQPPKISDRPNIVLIYSDDVDCETVFGQFPQQDSQSVQFANLKKMAEQGVRFSNFHVTTPVCGPSRACLYSGQYAHRNQCRVNDPKSIRSLGFGGGFTTFDRKNELASWMKQAGYTTAHIGKYLHQGFKPDRKNKITWKDIIPSGWDHFDVTLGSRYKAVPSYHMDEDKFVRESGEDVYRTDWEVQLAIKRIRNHATSGNQQPLLLCWSPIAAHIPGNDSTMIADRHQSLFADAQLPEFQQRLNAKPINQVEEMKAVVTPDTERREHLTNVYRDRMRALKALDEGIGALRSELEEQGMLENTIFIFTSDHGFRFAHHRHYGKRLPYDRITKVPFLVTGPGVPANVECDELLANIDIAPTLVALAGGRVPSVCDGKSFAKLMMNPNSPDGLDRSGILIENWGQAVSNSNVLPATYSSARTHHHIYTEWATGGREFYDLEADPEQIAQPLPNA